MAAMAADEVDGYEDDEEKRGLVYRSDESDDLKRAIEAPYGEEKQVAKRQKSERKESKKKSKNKMADMPNITPEKPEGSERSESENEGQAEEGYQANPFKDQQNPFKLSPAKGQFDLPAQPRMFGESFGGPEAMQMQFSTKKASTKKKKNKK